MIIFAPQTSLRFLPDRRKIVKNIRKIKIISVLIALNLLIIANAAFCQNPQTYGRQRQQNPQNRQISGRQRQQNPGQRDMKNKQQGDKDLFSTFFMLDRNNDLRLSTEELQVIRNPQRLERISAMDTNQDGQVSYQEIADSFAMRQASMVEQIKTKLAGKVQNLITEPQEIEKVANLFPVLKLKPDFYTEFDLNNDKKIDKPEALKSIAKMIAAFFAVRIKNIMKLVGTEPKQYEGDKLHIVARAMDYDADNKITANEFREFAKKCLKEDVVAYYQERKPVTTARATTEQMTPAQPTGLPLPTPDSEKQPLPAEPDDNAVFIVPQFADSPADETDAKDPLQELLGAGANEKLLW